MTNGRLEFAKRLARQAGDIMLQHFQIGVVSESKPEAGNTPVTAADRAINSMVIAAVKKHYPQDAVLGEEESYLPEDAEFTWVCDPLDGTIPYVMGIPVSVFSLACVNKSDGQPSVAAVYDPYMEREFWATKGGGAFLNGSPIKVSSINKLSHSYIGMSGSRSQTVKPAEFKGALIKDAYRPLMLNCVIYEAMLVACGQMAATVYLGFGAHDVATAKLIVEEAGGSVTDVFGGEQRYDEQVKGAVISNGLIHSQILDLVQQFKT